MAAKIVLNFKWSDEFFGSKAYIELFNFTTEKGGFPRLSAECVTPREIEEEARKLKRNLDEVVRQAKVKFAQSKKKAQQKIRAKKN